MHLLIFALSKEPATPAWIPLVALAVPLAIMLMFGIWAVKGRRRAAVGKQAQAAGRTEQETELGSAKSIADGGLFNGDALLKAMAIKPPDFGNTEDGPYNEGWGGEMLGLKSQISSASEVLEPHLFWGQREIAQVFIRIGPDEKLEGGTEMYTNRHIRDLTVVRVDAPRFVIQSQEGRLAAVEGSTPELDGILGVIAANAGVWGETSAFGGAEGIVVNRPGSQYGHFWIYDLWLAERIARLLSLQPLPDARIGPAWRVPYKLGRKFEPEFGE